MACTQAVHSYCYYSTDCGKSIPPFFSGELPEKRDMGPDCRGRGDSRNKMEFYKMFIGEDTCAGFSRRKRPAQGKRPSMKPAKERKSDRSQKETALPASDKRRRFHPQFFQSPPGGMEKRTFPRKCGWSFQERGCGGTYTQGLQMCIDSVQIQMDGTESYACAMGGFWHFRAVILRLLCMKVKMKMNNIQNIGV